MENLKLLHSWYTAGIINPDANVMTDSGKGHMFGNAQGWPSAAAGWAVGQGIDKYIVNKVFGPIYTTETIQGSMNAISVNSNHKEEALKLLQLMNTDSKFRDMCAYGIEGNHFEYTEDGFVNRLRDDWVWPSYTQGTFFIMSNQVGTDPNQWDEVKKQNEEAVPSTCLGFALDITNIQNEASTINTVWDKYKYDLLTGAKKSYLSAHPEVIQKFTNAIQKGLDYVNSHSAEEIAKVIQPQFKETPLGNITAIVERYKSQDTWKEDTIFEEQSFELLQNILEEAGELPKRVPYKDLVTTEFAEKAKK